MSTIADNLARIQERIVNAATHTGRHPEEITLVAVTKTIEPTRIREAVAAGAHDLGENYYQEVREKQPLFENQVEAGTVRWHFIGHLQSNKARYVAGRFALVQSVDTLELAEELGRRAVRQNVVQAVLLEVKLDPAGTKFGVEEAETRELAARIAAVPGVALRGLMGMAPFTETGEAARPHFARLRSLFETLPVANRQTLSMGMTNDFEGAIAEGSTMVRIGTAIFGRRV